MEVILLHGFDASPDDLVDVVAALREALPAWSVRALTGPVVLGPGRFGWWAEDDGVFPDAQHALHEMVDLIGSGPVVVAGFSQGGALAVACGFGGVDGAPILPNIRGVACVGGFVPDEVRVGPSRLRVFVGHGIDDVVVDVFHAESLKRVADRHGIEAELVLHDRGHEWPDTMTDDLVAWLKRPA